MRIRITFKSEKFRVRVRLGDQDTDVTECEDVSGFNSVGLPELRCCELTLLT